MVALKVGNLRDAPHARCDDTGARVDALDPPILRSTQADCRYSVDRMGYGTPPVPLDDEQLRSATGGRFRADSRQPTPRMPLLRCRRPRSRILVKRAECRGPRVALQVSGWKTTSSLPIVGVRRCRLPVCAGVERHPWQIGVYIGRRTRITSAPPAHSVALPNQAGRCRGTGVTPAPTSAGYCVLARTRHPGRMPV